MHESGHKFDLSIGSLVQNLVCLRFILTHFAERMLGCGHSWALWPEKVNCGLAASLQHLHLSSLLVFFHIWLSGRFLCICFCPPLSPNHPLPLLFSVLSSHFLLLLFHVPSIKPLLLLPRRTSAPPSSPSKSWSSGRSPTRSAASSSSRRAPTSPRWWRFWPAPRRNATLGCSSSREACSPCEFSSVLLCDSGACKRRR